MGEGRAGHGPRAADAALSGGELLRRYRSAAGLTQEDLAERAGYSANYVGKLERGQRELPAAAAEHLAAVLGLAGPQRAALRAAQEHGGEQELPAPVPPGGPLAGRDAELAQIGRLLAGAGPPVLLLAGEPGIGKTRLLAEAAGRAAGAGWGIARGGCLRRAQDPYAPLSGALADALGRLPARDRAGALRQAGPVDLLLPELPPPRGPGPGGGWAPGGGRPEQQRRLLASCAGRLLRAAAGPAGTLLVLDDLHWAGPDAVALLAAVLAAAGPPPVRLIGAYRDSEAPARLGELVADLARASLVRVLPLGPLTDAEAARLLTRLAAAGPQVPAIVRRAGGVPFFLVSYAEQARDAGPGAALLAVPWTVAQVIGQRVAALPGPARDLLSAAAVAGPVVPHRLLARVAGRTDDEVIEALEAALAARLLAEDGPDRYRFPHDLIRETVEDGLSAARRRLLHRRIGQALEGEPGAAAEALAFHFAQAGEDGTAAGYLERAGDQAGQRVAWSAAAEFYAAAAARLEAAGRAADAVPVTGKQGVALYRAGRYGAAITVLEAALAGYRAAGDAEAIARLTGRLADAHYRAGTRIDALAELTGLAEGDPARAGAAATPGALARWEGLGQLLYAQGSGTKMVAVGRSLARAGRAAGNGTLAAVGARIHGAGLICQGRLPEGTALLAATMPPDAAVSDERAAYSATLLSGAYLAMGCLDRCETLSTRMLAAAGQAGEEVVIAMHTVLLGNACYVRGDWRRGRDLIGRARDRFAALSSPMAVRFLPGVAPTLIWQGAWQEARAYLDTSLQAARSMRIVHIERAALAHLAELDVLEGHPQDAVTRLHPVTAAGPAPRHNLTWEYAVQLLSAQAAAYLELRDLDRARAYADRAVAEARRMAVWVQGIRALQVQGMIQARRGNHDLARAAYQEGLNRAAAMPFPYGQARLLHADGLLDHQQQDHAAGHAKFAQALAILQNLGADKDAARLRQSIAQTPSA